jgi:NAD(P)-dependent dehydrogenase (short-subunit alcohol dehydrogenase family)
MKIILITGASSGIGFSTAKTLAKQGHRVYAAARRVELMEPLKADGAIPLRMDVTDSQSIKDGVGLILEKEGRIDVLINNAGYGYFGPVETVPDSDARRQLEVNLFGLAALCRLVLPAMREQGSGRIINVASVAGSVVMYYGGWYNVTKFAVEALTDALRVEMKPFGVDVIAVSPGAIGTAWGNIAADHLAESTAGTPYEKTGGIMADNMHWLYGKNILSKPETVTRAISKAVNSRRPRARYRPGLGARALIFFKRILPTPWFDAMLRQMGKIQVVKK